MKFSTLQEQEYGVGLPQGRLHGDTNEAVMAAIESMESKNNNILEEGSVVSNLPLLFANGHPTSLEKITLAQLERFVTFMVQCSLGHDTADAITEPRWWPKEVKFSNPLTRPKRANDNWMANLKKLVFRCYTYHRSEYLLRFCSYLARYPHEDLEYINNWDSTTSLYHKNSGKLLVTFRNENMNYDRKSMSPKKKLLSCNGVASCYSTKAKQQQRQHSDLIVQPRVKDIYLCNNCDAEFIDLGKMKEHELVCCERNHNGGNSRSATPETSVAEPEFKQDQFLEYFHLRSVTAEPKSVLANTDATVNDNVGRRTSRRIRGSISFVRCPTIPFSSPAGILLAKKSKTMTEETQQERLERIERHLVAPVLNESCRPKWLEAEIDRDRWNVTYKPNREKPADDYVHEYQFVNSTKRKPMLSIQSQLLYVLCRPVYVLLTRLTQERINDLKQDPLKYSLVRKVSVDNKDSTMRNRENLRPNVSSKRKAPCDENESNAMIGYDGPTNETAVGISAVFELSNSCNKNNLTIIKPKTEIISCAKPSGTITLVDLCSSDEEQDSSTAVSSDENRDPLNPITDDMTKSFFQKISATKLQLTPRICTTDQRSEWLSDNILNGGGENSTSRFHSTTLSARASLSPVLRPAP